ncbi:dihydroorotate oxidase [Candidatus Pacebacteria bacterium]|nr:dihydroorotate oxidase [Candidatus Paceibacterota bacterium]
MVKQESFYNPKKSYYENYEEGPFGVFTEDTSLERIGDPTDTFLGVPVYVRFGIPAGPLLNGTYVKAALDKGFDLPVYKTVRTREKKCHPYPNVLPALIAGDLTLEKAEAGLTTKEEYSDPLSITNSFGVPSFSPDVWQEDVADAVLHAKEGQLVGASFEGTRWDGFSDQDYIDDWVTAAKLLKETNVGFIEANLSCPNEGTAALLCFDVEKVVEVTSAIKDAVGDLPLFIKTSYFTEDSLLEKLVKEVGGIVDGFATINTISAEVRTPDGGQALPGEGRLRSGVCGHSIKWASTSMVARLATLREKHQKSYKIIGVGGVTKAEDYGEYIDAGADAVMSATGAMWNPLLAQDVYMKYAS